MTLYRIALLGVALIPSIATAQPTSDVANLRSRAVTEGSVELKVTTRAVADAALTPSSLTDVERIAIQRAQQKILLELMPRGLVVGNEINAEQDGSFTMWVLPEGVDRLAANADVVALDAVATSNGARP